METITIIADVLVHLFGDLGDFAVDILTDLVGGSDKLSSASSTTP